MSVINQMLRDLDKRQAADPALRRTPGVTVSQPRRWYWALLVLPALWLGVELGRQDQAQSPTAAAKPATKPVAMTESLVGSAGPAMSEVADPEPLAAAPDKIEVAPAAAVISVPATTATDPEPRSESGAPAQAAETAEPQLAVSDQTDSLSGPEVGAQAYALADSDTAFLAESETAEPPALTPPAAPVVKPQMTISAADPQRVAQQQQQNAAALQWARLQQYAALQQWQLLLDALTPTLQQQYPQQVLALEAHAAQQVGDTDRAIQAYQRWSQLMPQDSRPWLGMGTLLDQREQWPEAQQAYQQALQLGGLSPASRQFIQQRLASATGQ